MTIKTFPVLVFIFITIIFIFPAHYSFAQTIQTPPDTQVIIKQLQALIISLQSQINELKAKLEITRKEVEIVKSEIQFTKSLVRGTEGDEVKQLQEVLSKDPEIYPEGKVTGFFGPATEAAVKRFQEKHGIESLGTIGPKTRAKLNQLITEGAGRSGVIPPGLERRFGTTTPEQASPTFLPSIPSGTIPAQPVGQTGTTTIPAVPVIIVATSTIGTSTAVTSTPSPLSPSGTTPPAGTIGSLSSSTGASTITTATPPLLPSPDSIPPSPSPSPSTGGTATTTATSTVDTISPSVPTNLTATVVSSTQINLSWIASSDNIGIAGYWVYRNSSQIATITSGTAYSDTNLAGATAYLYTVAAYDAAGNVSAQSNLVSATTIIESPPPSAYPFAWIRHFGSTGNDELRGVIADSSGNATVAGLTRIGNTASMASAALARYDASGNQLWVKSLVGSASTAFMGLAADSSGILYATGYTYGAVDENVFLGGSGDGLIVSYDSQGIKRWVRFVGGTGSEWLHHITVDGSGNIYAVGYTTSSIDGLVNAGGYGDGLIVKYDNAGNRIWTRLLGTKDWEQLYGVTADQFGNVYVVGYSTGSFPNQVSAGGYSDMLIAKYDGNGNQLWVRLMGGSSGIDEFHSVVSDDASSIYAVGYTSSPSVDGQTSNGGQDGVIVKYDVDGNRLWTRLFGESRSDGFLASAYKNGNVYVAGSQSIGSLWDTDDGVIVAYDSSGNKIKSTIISSAYKTDTIVGIAVDSSVNVYGVGLTGGTLYDQTSNGGYDGFVVKYNQGVLTSALNNVIRNLASMLSALQNLLTLLR